MLSYREIIEISCKNGFYLLTKIIINTVSQKVEGQEGQRSFSSNYFPAQFFGSWGSLHNSIDETHAVSFGNLSIIKLFIKDSSQFELDKILSISVLKGYENIVKYFLNDLVKTNVYKITAEGISQALSNSVMKKSSKLFDYIMEQVNLNCPDFFEKFDWSIKMLSNACIHGNVKCAKAITEFILKSKKNKDFTLPFVNAASFNSFELCNFFVDKKVKINFSNIATFSSEMASMKEEIFLLIIDKLSHDEKENLYKKIIIPAIRCHNIPLIEIIYKEMPVNRECFFEAVESSDCEIVKITLKYKNNSSFINKKSPNGTPLIIATRNNDTDIVKALLSVPENNPNLYDRIGDTPLIIAAMSMNLDILNLILDFYGDEIQNQKSQLDSLILKTMNLMNIPEWKSKQDIINIINRVLDIKFIDPNVFKNDNTMLMLACESNEINIV